jgi:2-iminobutanoate/2-iminopropanoate deaminase
MMRRRSVVVPAIAHKFPVPNASRIGSIVVSGAIHGVDATTSAMPPDLETQCANMFRNLRSVVEASGATMDDVIKVTVFIRDRDRRGPLNAEWEKAFPDPASRPARHAQPLQIDGPSLIQCDFMAVIGG